MPVSSTGLRKKGSRQPNTPKGASPPDVRIYDFKERVFFFCSPHLNLTTEPDQGSPP